MKKIVALLLATVMCCGMLAGCGSKEKSETKDFNAKTNQKVSMRGYFFEVPENWKKGDNTEELQYYYPEDGMLLVSYSEMEESISDKETREEFLDSFGSSMEKYKLLSESEIELNGNDAYKLEMNLRMDEKDFSSTMILFDCNGGMLSFMMSTLKKSEKDYSKDFDNVVKSISKPLPFEKTLEDVDFLLEKLKLGGVCNFSSMDVGEESDTPLKSWSDTEKGVLITAVGDENRKITSIHGAAKDEQEFTSVCTMTLMGVGVISTNATDLLTNLSPDKLKEMKSGPEGAIIEVIDGVSYLIQKSDDGAYKYSFTLQRDMDTKNEYEEYLRNRELLK